MKRNIVRNENLLYPELSYKIVGSAFDVYNELGGGHPEKYYQKALKEVFLRRNILFKEQLFCPIYFCGKSIGKRFLDFLVEGKIIVEIKKGYRFSKTNIDQVLNYLKINNFKLAILINFGHDGVQFKRIINFNS